MPLANRLGFWILAGLGLGLTSGANANLEPRVPSYDRYHSETPSIDGGQLLFNELGCVNCHSHATGLPQKMGPRLGGISSRIHPDWISAFLQNPSGVKPGATMPDLRLEEDEAESIVHFLLSLESERETPRAFKFVNRQRGFELYHKIGCVACHEPGKSAVQTGTDAVLEANSPYPDLKIKYDIHSLSDLLYNTHVVRPRGRMPQFDLEREDGGDIAAYLLDYANGDSTEYPRIAKSTPEPSKVRRGEALVNRLNCVSCHDIPGLHGSLEAPKTRIANNLDRLPPDHPQYQLSDGQWNSIALFLEQGPSEPSATLAMEALNCLACHERDGRGGPNDRVLSFFTGDPDLGDAGRIPPPLTGVGRKLKPQWLRSAISGDSSERPYLNVQMPNFGESVENLHINLQEDDAQETRRRFPKGDAVAGQSLLGSDGGLNCIACHSWGDRESLGIRGMNLSALSRRLERDWFNEFLIDPAAKRPNTLMPSFWPNGIASNQTILQGDTDAQIAAIYAFAETGTGLPNGYPESNVAAFEIVPKDGPVVQRSFLKGVGTDALLVGFPSQLHYAVNGKTGRPALLWKGRFFDAYRTWFSRFPEFETPLGSDIVAWRDARSNSGSAYRGYRSGDDGSPIFISEYLGAVMYDQLQPEIQSDGSLAMKRTVRYTQERQLEDSLLSHPEGVETTELPGSDPLIRIFLYQW